ncbi:MULTISPECIES: hypothetical protein [Paraburkholderia]|uniref:Uncharacterized protein n=1 Tax=Paraburkholderia podalyriae TaxID=1938811 RepID=A0ABR7Q0U5_9BURK|nr:hypothetical protein [Paraburkholderia podalyriae]MBC8752171.1 hypothetical protein [Paraburkholderia podalyriae]
MSLEEYKSDKYAGMTERLNSALSTLRENPTLPATQEIVAQLASCSLRLLHTPKRNWVLTELSDIKDKRRKTSTVSDGPPTGESATGDLQKLSDLLEKQNAHISELMGQNGELFREAEQLKAKISEMNTAVSDGESELNVLRVNLREAQEEIFRLQRKRFE